jgi:CelD/BcsL family acetyltransferase involved in cellulose biosynthesis
MRVLCFRTLEELAPYAGEWDRLSGGVPLRGWTWLSTWWRHYGHDDERQHPRMQLFVPCVFDDRNTLVGLAPWYFEGSASHGRVLRMLGSGEVCSDYLSVLCQPGMEEPVTGALADRLTDDAGGQRRHVPCWDLLEMTGIDAEDRVVGRLLDQLSGRGITVHRRPGMNCWRTDLPTSWDAYLATVSKNRRRQIHRTQRDYITNGRAALHVVERSDELPAALDLLIDLHQRRQQALGNPGCFASPRFTAFNREVVPALFRRGQLQLYRLDVDGRPVATEYVLSGDGILYAYQAGVDPAALEHEPGKLINLLMIRRAIEQGYRSFDFLRGDEPYKAHFAAAARPSIEVRVVADRAAARLRHSFWLAKYNVKRWLKRRLKPAPSA